ncbi:MAG: hypothetical protein Q7R71_02215 [bacterium]|nr:hypothetical protein [bacterium]
MMQSTTTWIVATSFLIATAGFLLPFWPLTVVGIGLCALSGRFLFAIAIGLLLDVGYGAPVGPWHALYVPFTLCALLFSALCMIGERYMLKRNGPTL